MPDNDDTLLTQNNPNAEGDDDKQAANPNPDQGDGNENGDENNPPTDDQTKGKGEDDQAANNEDQDGNKDEDDDDAGAPESYEDFSVPEGFTVNEEQLGEYHRWAKDTNLTQDQAQQGIDMFVKIKEAEQAQWVEQQKSWVDQAKSDSEYGGDKFDENISVAVKARESFGTPEFVEMLEVSGLGNHPEMIRFLNRVGQAISEDKVIVGGNSGDKSHESVLYPSMSK